jgi:REP element-mobilizing transposase RayT
MLEVFADFDPDDRCQAAQRWNADHFNEARIRATPSACDSGRVPDLPDVEPEGRVAAALLLERERIAKQPKRAGESSGDRKIRENKLIFAMADRILDRAIDGPMYLKDAAVAKIVEDSIIFGVPERYDLFAWCVMANHVHVLLTPRWDTAHEINALQDSRGRIFWQDESYDHWARDEVELLRIIAYIENNPVAAALCSCPEDWPWSSARHRTGWDRGKPFQRRSGLPA